MIMIMMMIMMMMVMMKMMVKIRRPLRGNRRVRQHSQYTSISEPGNERFFYYGNPTEILKFLNP